MTDNSRTYTFADGAEVAAPKKFSDEEFVREEILPNGVHLLAWATLVADDWDWERDVLEWDLSLGEIEIFPRNPDGTVKFPAGRKDEFDTVALDVYMDLVELTRDQVFRPSDPNVVIRGGVWRPNPYCAAEIKAVANFDKRRQLIFEKARYACHVYNAVACGQIWRAHLAHYLPTTDGLLLLEGEDTVDPWYGQEEAREGVLEHLEEGKELFEKWEGAT